MFDNVVAYMMDIQEEDAQRLSYGVRDKMDRLTGYASAADLQLAQLGDLLELIMYRLERLEETCLSSKR